MHYYTFEFDKILVSLARRKFPNITVWYTYYPDQTIYCYICRGRMQCHCTGSSHDRPYISGPYDVVNCHSEWHLKQSNLLAFL